MAQNLLDLPDQVLTQILVLLPTPRALLNTCMAARALQAVVADECWEAHSEAQQWLVRRRQEGEQLESCEAHFRRVHTTKYTIVLVGGECGGEVVSPLHLPSAVEAFDPVGNAWLEQPPLPPALPISTSRWRNAPCTACDRGVVFVVGGWDDEDDEALSDVATFRVPTVLLGDTVERDAPVSVDDAEGDAPAHARSKWMWPAHALSHDVTYDHESAAEVAAEEAAEEAHALQTEPISLPDMPEARCFAAATFDAAGCLWVVGGGDAMTRGASCLDSITIIDPYAEVPTWRPFGGKPMLKKRCGLALACDGKTHALYLCGGYSGGTTYQDTVELLDMAGISDGELLPPMRHGRSGCGAGVGPDSALYVVGGSDNGSNMLASCERYDPREGSRWHELPDLPTPRGYLAACFAPDGSLIVSGGCEDGWGSPVDALEAFDTRAGRWRTLPSLPHARSNHAIVNAWCT